MMGNVLCSMRTCAQARGHWMSTFITFCLIPLRQGFFLNVDILLCHSALFLWGQVSPWTWGLCVLLGWQSALAIFLSWTPECGDYWWMQDYVRLVLWVLGSKLSPQGCVASAFNHWIISSVHTPPQFFETGSVTGLECAKEDKLLLGSFSFTSAGITSERYHALSFYVGSGD